MFGIMVGFDQKDSYALWIFVITAPVAELTVVSFTVPLNGLTIVATATVVTSCSSSGVCVAMLCGGGGTSLDDAYDSAWDSVLPTVVGCVVMSCGGESFFPAVLTITHGIALSR